MMRKSPNVSVASLKMRGNAFIATHQMQACIAFYLYCFLCFLKKYINIKCSILYILLVHPHKTRKKRAYPYIEF